MVDIIFGDFEDRLKVSVNITNYFNEEILELPEDLDFNGPDIPNPEEEEDFSDYSSIIGSSVDTYVPSEPIQEPL